MTTVFVLKAYNIEYEWTEVGMIPASYPEFKKSKKQIGIYSTLKQAEKAIKRHKKSLQKEDSDRLKRRRKYKYLEDGYFHDKNDNSLSSSASGSLYGFEIKEVVLDMETYSTEKVSKTGRRIIDYYNIQNEYAYLPDGSWCVNVKHSLSEECALWGGSCYSTIQSGDIVEYFNDNKVRLGMKIYDDSESFGWSTVIIDVDAACSFKDGDDVSSIKNSYANATHVFPARFPVSTKVKEAFTRVINRKNPYVWLTRYIQKNVKREFKINFIPLHCENKKSCFEEICSEGYSDYGMDNNAEIISTFEELLAKYQETNADYCAILNKMISFLKDTSSKPPICPVTEDDKLMVKMCLDMVGENTKYAYYCVAICCGLSEFMKGKEYIPD